ncbi:hypothetical protein HF1_11950 [Mycoplasma haemofelis str. Langford 1]|uniref:Uncharacterized protein n=1 Tax=Mycoplasma haemofelis (strain Langford 1) TaxID=941640 RepID=E8ZJ82_MYCHL|nr:hypothetical protein [Mycoplasma haemofelis]CBY93203.1 hypothetical protein HF1_11950 [Mycoplasma haemofelis str. Langford 1]
MSLSIAKTAAGLGAASGASGLGYLSYHYAFSDDPKIAISELFKREGRMLLTKESDSEQWTERWKAYLGGDSNIWKLDDYDAKKGDKDKAPDSFKNKCLSNSTVEVSGIEDSLYLEVVKNCSKEFKINDLVTGDSKITNLDSSSGSNEDWKVAWKNYLADNKDSNPWELTDWSTKKAASGDQISDDLKTKCNTKKDEKVFGSRDPKFSNFVRWCSKVSG